MNAIHIKMLKKGFVDSILVIGFFACIVSVPEFEENQSQLQNLYFENSMFSFLTSHCIISIVLVGFIGFHIYQHWYFYKALFSKKQFYKKNKITILTSIAFIITCVSIGMYLAGFLPHILKFHSFITHLFVIMLVIHIISKWKQLMNIFKFELFKR